MRIIEDIVSDGHGYLDPDYIVIHETANPGATARNHRDYWSRDDTYAVHYVGDWTGDVYHCVPDNCLCWQVGNGNAYVVGIELCHATNSADFQRVWDVGVEWAALMLERYGWGIDRLISHNDCTNWWGGSDHTDPIGYFESYGRSWGQFKQDVENVMEDGMTNDQIKLLAQEIASAWDQAMSTRDEKAEWGAMGKGTGKFYRNNYNTLRFMHELLINLNTNVAKIVKKLGA